MANDVDTIAAKLAALYRPTEPKPEPAEPEPAPEPGKGNVIPSAGHQPSGIPTEAQQIALAEQAGDHETAARLKHSKLARLIENTYYNYFK